MKVDKLFSCAANILEDTKWKEDEEKSHNEGFYILFYLS